MAEKDSDPLADLAAKSEIDGKSGVLNTNIDAGACEHQPHDSELRPSCWHSGKLEAQHDTTLRQRTQINLFAQPPHQQCWVEIGGLNPIVCVGYAPLAERVHYRAQALAGRREPVLMTGAVGARPAFNDTIVLELTQPRDQDGAGDQRHAAMDVVEGVHASHQFAHDERSPAGGENL